MRLRVLSECPLYKLIGRPPPLPLSICRGSETDLRLNHDRGRDLDGIPTVLIFVITQVVYRCKYRGDYSILFCVIGPLDRQRFHKL